jgi:hypothetical protein
MATATIIGNVTVQNNMVSVCVQVAEGGNTGNVQYCASVPAVDANGNALSQATVKANLIFALQAVRNAQINPPTTLPISGTVTL